MGTVLLISLILFIVGFAAGFLIKQKKQSKEQQADGTQPVAVSSPEPEKQDEVRIWTIDDAKDGDILAYNNGAKGIVFMFMGLSSRIFSAKTVDYYCCMYDDLFWANENKTGFLAVSDTNCNKYSPATKMQRDTFFAKMKEAGYRWDAEAKQLVSLAEKQEPKPEEKVTADPVAPVAPDTGYKLLGKIGLISDIHFDTYDKHNSAYAADIRNALDYFVAHGVDCVMACGDICEYNDEDLQGFYDLYKPYYDKGLRLFTCLGNHDYLRLYEDGQNKEQLWQQFVAKLHCIPGATENTEADIHFFESGVKWDDPQRTGVRNAKTKQNYWMEINGDIYVFVSVDYGKDPIPTGNTGTLARAVNLLDNNNTYVKMMKQYVDDTPYDDAKERNWNYQFYDPEVLCWLRDILEGNTHKRVFVFSHHFLPHKAGNGNTFNKNWYYSQLRMWPHTDNLQINQRYYSGSNTLCGLEFWFLNELNNIYKNVYWFSGHSHITFFDEKYQDDLIFCKNDYNVIKPDGTETVPIVDDVWSLRGGPYDYKRYTRADESAIAGCALNIHLPSLSKPLTISEKSAKTHYGGSEGMVMELWEHKVVFSSVVFNVEGSDKYLNREIAYRTFYN